MKKFSVLSSWRTALGNLLPSAHGHQGGNRRVAIGSIGAVLLTFLVACGDSSSASAENNEPTTLSSAEGQWSSSSSVILSGDSHEGSSASSSSATSSSSKNETPKSYAEAKVMPSGTYDCTKYQCTSTTQLNQEFLETGKYGEILDERDGRVYKTVKIGEQIWMAENLNYRTVNSWCGAQTEIDGDCVYGRLYIWFDAMNKTEEECLNRLCDQDAGNVQGACPYGWHLPTKGEWETLLDAVGGKDVAGQKLKSRTSFWEEYEDTEKGILENQDAFGFAAEPAGGRDCEGDWESGNGYITDDGHNAIFWSTTQFGSAYAYYMFLGYDYDDAGLGFYDIYNGYSVRCLKD